MRYAYHDLYPQQFESLVVAICHDLLGPGVQEFATGPDGGRDAKFVGRAQSFPSATAPLEGKFVVQAKHTSNPIGKFSDSDFSGDGVSTTLREEYPRIKTLFLGGELQHYLLFSNRRLGAEANRAICEELSAQTGVASVHLIGVEALERLLKRIPHTSATLAEYQNDMPLRASPDELAEVIVELTAKRDKLDWNLSTSASVQERISFKAKNSANGLSDTYADSIIRNYLRDFDVVRRFLSDPANYRAAAMYADAAADFACKLAAYQNRFDAFDRLLDHLLDGLIERDGDLRANKRITRTVFYFMYWTCDIGHIGGTN